MRKKMILLLVTMGLLVNQSSLAFAVEYQEITDPTISTEVPISIEVIGEGGGEPPIDPPPIDPPVDLFSVSLPVSLPVTMNSSTGAIVVPTDAKIINNMVKSTSEGAMNDIKVKEISVSLGTDWTLIDFDEDITSKEDVKEVGLKVRGDSVVSNSISLSKDNWNIPADSELQLNLNLKIPKQTMPAASDSAATLSFSFERTSLQDTVTPVEHLVIFETGVNGELQGTTSFTVKDGETVSFPVAVPSSSSYVFDKWIDQDGVEISEESTITKPMTITAIFKLVPASPTSYFVVNTSTGELTGMSDGYNNMEDAPKNLVIPKSVGGRLITNIGSTAFAGRNDILSVVLPTTVVTISDNAFKGCTAITSIGISEGVANIGNEAFKDCTSLSDINIPSTIVSLGNKAFENCSNLDLEMNLPKNRVRVEKDTFLNTKSVNIINKENKKLIECLVAMDGLVYILDSQTNVTINNKHDDPHVVTGRMDSVAYTAVFLDENKEVLTEYKKKSPDVYFNIEVGYNNISKEMGMALGNYKHGSFINEYKPINYDKLPSYVYIGEAYENYPSGTVYPVNKLANLFAANSKLTHLPKLPVNPYLKDLYGTFSNRAISSFPEIGESVVDMNSTFYGCKNVTGEIIIPKYVTTFWNVFDDTVKPITMKYYKDCEAAVKYVAPANVTKVQID